VQSGASKNIDVLANDSDPDGDLDRDSLRIVSGPSFGSANVQTDHKIRFQAPLLALAASTDVVYEICDLQGRCDQATLSIDVFILGGLRTEELPAEPPTVPIVLVPALLAGRRHRRGGHRGTA
jgi:hypothetical protein